MREIIRLKCIELVLDKGLYIYFSHPYFNGVFSVIVEYNQNSGVGEM